MADMDEGSKGGRRSVFEHSAIEHRVARNQRLAEPVKQRA
jgi:hypothetical protein